MYSKRKNKSHELIHFLYCWMTANVNLHSKPDYLVERETLARQIHYISCPKKLRVGTGLIKAAGAIQNSVDSLEKKIYIKEEMAYFILLNLLSSYRYQKSSHHCGFPFRTIIWCFLQHSRHTYLEFSSFFCTKED